MNSEKLACPSCGHDITKFHNPYPTTDIIIEAETESGPGVVLIKRKFEPIAWAIPGGFVDYGETLETAAVREAKEETSLDVEISRQFHVYSDPKRDKRRHTISTVFIARIIGGEMKAADDAAEIGVFTRHNIPGPLAFDHDEIIRDYFGGKY